MKIKIDTIKQRVNIQNVLFWSILLFSFLIRIIALAKIPNGVNQDEAMAAVDAWALSKYGTDRFGMKLPVHFTAWGYGQMSVLLSYCMVPFLWLFGFNTFTIRLPMVFASVLGVALVYLISKKLFTKNVALAAMAFVAINPWHFMQSRWSLDCNLFPHVFLLGLYLLLLGMEKRKFLYWSMVCFGLTFYCYGVAVYTVPLFLLFLAIYCLCKKLFTLKEVFIAIAIFVIVALPEILVMLINMYGWQTIETPLFTMAYFPDSIRSNDILLLNFSWEALKNNATALYTQVFLQKPDAIYNAIPEFGPLYKISTLFIPIGIVTFIKYIVCEKDSKKKCAGIAILFYLLMSIWAGLTTYRVNLNRINIIFYALIFIIVHGIYTVCGWFKTFMPYAATSVITLYVILASSFFAQYFTQFPNDASVAYHRDLLAIIEETDSLEQYDEIYASTYMGCVEILTQYICKLDARYCQGITNETNDRVLLPYNERYHFIKINQLASFDTEAIYIMHKNEYYSLSAYADIILENDSYVAVDFR